MRRTPGNAGVVALTKACAAVESNAPEAMKRTAEVIKEIKTDADAWATEELDSRLEELFG